MDKIIDRLSDIEKAAGSLMDDAGVRKKALAKEMEEKTAAFDRELEQKTAARISCIQKQMEQEMQEELDKQAADARGMIARLEETYEKQLWNGGVLSRNSLNRWPLWKAFLRQSVFFAPCRRMRRFFPVLRIKSSTGGGLNSF